MVHPFVDVFFEQSEMMKKLLTNIGQNALKAVSWCLHAIFRIVWRCIHPIWDWIVAIIGSLGLGLYLGSMTGVAALGTAWNGSWIFGPILMVTVVLLMWGFKVTRQNFRMKRVSKKT